MSVKMDGMTPQVMFYRGDLRVDRKEWEEVVLHFTNPKEDKMYLMAQQFFGVVGEWEQNLMRSIFNEKDTDLQHFRLEIAENPKLCHGIYGLSYHRRKGWPDGVEPQFAPEQFNEGRAVYQKGFAGNETLTAEVLAQNPGRYGSEISLYNNSTYNTFTSFYKMGGHATVTLDPNWEPPQ
ncbi:MAG: hypothetical protein S4CHLAM102_02780 [Chlamydiia bacterium]|nr:hypothetical protein [Chlamydiia bacterium]